MSPEQAVARLKSADEGLRSLSCDFSQSLLLGDAGGGGESAAAKTGFGTLQFKKEQKIRIEHMQPQRQTVASNGEEIVVYMHEGRQVIREKWSKWKTNDALSKSLFSFGKYAKLLEDYDIAVATQAWLETSTPTFIAASSSAAVAASTATLTAEAPSATLMAYRLDLTPKDARIPISMVLIVDADNFIPFQTELILTHMRVSSRLSGIRINPEIDDSAFDFKVPAGAVEIRMPSWPENP